MRYWLMKSEPSEMSIDAVAASPRQTVEWFGVRNYQARNFMRDLMQPGDLGLFWHSSCKNPGIYGLVEVVTAVHPDSHQFDLQSKYYDPKSTRENPRWWCVDVKFAQKTRYVAIEELRAHPDLSTLQVLQKGNRLSITTVDSKEWQIINQLI